MKSLFGRKPISELLSESETSGLRRELVVKDLVMLSIGAVIGAGIFSTLGAAAAGELGPDGVTVIRFGAGPGGSRTGIRRRGIPGQRRQRRRAKFPPRSHLKFRRRAVGWPQRR